MAYSPEQWDKAKTFFESGQFSLSQISDKVGIGKSAISKMAKNQQWNNEENSDYIEAKKTLAVKKSTLNSTVIQTLDDIADEQIRNKNLVYGVTQKALQKAHDLLDEIDNANDLKAIVELSDRASITLKVNERHAPRAEVKLTNGDDNSNTNNLTIEQISVAIANGLPN